MMRLRSSLGWRAHGNVSISSSSGMLARLRRRIRALSHLVRYSASSTCFKNRSWEKRARVASASNSSQWASSPRRRRYFRILHNPSSIVVLAWWCVVAVFARRCLVIGAQIWLVGQAAFLVSRPLAKVLIKVRKRQAPLGLTLTHAEPGDALERLQMDDS